MSCKKKRRTAEEFVTSWQTSETLDEVCETLEMKAATAQARASTYRKQGVNLKKFPKALIFVNAEPDGLGIYLQSYGTQKLRVIKLLHQLFGFSYSLAAELVREVDGGCPSFLGDDFDRRTAWAFGFCVESLGGYAYAKFDADEFALTTLDYNSN